MFSGKYAFEICINEKKILMQLKTCDRLQLDEIRVSYSSVGDSAGFKTFKNPVLTINDHKVGSFSDISLEHKISPGRISVL
jgi:hypothetical protein